MPKYRIFAGLNGGFGGAQEIDIEEHPSLEAAEYAAESYAREEYENYGGLHGLFNVMDALDENPDLTEEELDAMCEEDIEDWIEYYAELVSDEDSQELTNKEF